MNQDDIDAKADAETRDHKTDEAKQNLELPAGMVRQVQGLRLEPSDVILLQPDRLYDRKTLEYLTNIVGGQLTDYGIHNRIVVLPHGLTLSVLQQSGNKTTRGKFVHCRPELDSNRVITLYSFDCPLCSHCNQFEAYGERQNVVIDCVRCKATITVV